MGDLAEPHARACDATFEQAPIGMVRATVDGVFRQINGKYRQLFGYSAVELNRMSFLDLTHPDDRAGERDALARLLAGELAELSLEKRCVRADDRVIWIAQSVAVVRDESAQPTALIVTAQDITARKQLESERARAFEQAEAGRRLLDALLEHIPIGITIADAPDVRIRAVSRYGRELTGRSAAALEQVTVDQHVEAWHILRADGSPADNAELPLTRATQHGEDVREEEWLIVRPDGTRIPMLCSAGPIRDAAGEVVGGVIGWQDIADKQATESLLREREERLRLVIDATEIGAFDYYPRTGRLEWSPHAKLHFGLPPDAEVDFGLFLRGLHPDDRPRVERIIAEVQRPESGGEYATEYRTIGLVDGKERWLSARGRVSFDAAGRPERFVGVTLDITERKRAEQRQRESDRRKDDFLAMLGHELRNPLAAIRHATELIKRIEPDDARLRRAYAVLERQSAQMTRLIDGLLDVSRIARGKIDLYREVLDLRELIDVVVHDQRAHADARSLALALVRWPAPLWVFGDRVRLVQVLDNIIGNALKFTDPPGRIEVDTREADGCAIICVHDTGVGIPADMLDRLFDPFQQAPQDIARSAGGLGLGLAVAKGLVELHEGRVEARSAGLGRGAEFEVRLPLSEPPNRAASAPEPARSERRRILLIEDNADAAASLRDLLELLGHAVTVAGTGQAGLATLRERGVDMVLCDLGLPGMTGLEFAGRVRADPDLRGVPLVALTGYGQPEDRKRSAAAGFDEHLVKPLELATLERVLARSLAPR